MTILKDLVVVVGTYESSGSVKKKYLTIGKMLDGPKGPFIVLDPWVNLAAIPRPDNSLNIFVNLYDPITRSEAPRTKSSAKQHDDNDDDIPF